jgi:hypothetical protein
MQMKLFLGNDQLIRGFLEKINFSKLWIARALIGLILFFNIHCAIAFILFPDYFLSSFELEGISGRIVLQGMGILFIMWNVPYTIALAHPQRYKLSLYSAFIMQLIGLFGESILLMTIPDTHRMLISTARRFILFDGFGLVALLLAILLSRVKLTADISIS